MRLSWLSVCYEKLVLILFWSMLPVTIQIVQCPKNCKCPDNFGFEVNCKYANLEDVPSDCNEALSFLDLSHNNIHILKNNSFANRKLVKIDRLHLNNNNMTTIEVNAFRGMPDLKLLNLGLNNITTISSHVFDTNVEIEVLTMDRNTMIQLPNVGFNLPNLDILSLRWCNIQNIPVNFFENMTKLEYVFLYGNLLSFLHPILITPTTRLKLLDLRDNKFTTIHVDLVKILPKTLLIKFDFNPLHCDCQLQLAYLVYRRRYYHERVRCETPHPMNLTVNQHKSTCNEKSSLASASVGNDFPAAISNPPNTKPPKNVTEIYTHDPINNLSSNDSFQATMDRTTHQGNISINVDKNKTSTSNVNSWWIALSVVAIVLVVVLITIVLIKRTKKVTDNLFQIRFSVLKHHDSK